MDARKIWRGLTSLLPTKKTTAMRKDQVETLQSINLQKTNFLLTQTKFDQAGSQVTYKPRGLAAESYPLACKILIPPPAATPTEKVIQGLNMVRAKMNPPTPTASTGLNPYVILEDQTPYGIAITAPAELFGDWEPDMHTMGSMTPGQSGQTIQLGEKRKSLSVLVRVNGADPLTREKLPNGNHQEIYLHGFQPLDGPLSLLLLKDRLTFEGQGQAAKEPLIFSTPPSGSGEKAGLVEVFIFSVEETRPKQSQQPRPAILTPPSHKQYSLIPTLGSPSFSSGETRFGAAGATEMTGVPNQNRELIAAFSFTLVAPSGPHETMTVA